MTRKLTVSPHDKARLFELRWRASRPGHPGPGRAVDAALARALGEGLAGFSIPSVAGLSGRRLVPDAAGTVYLVVNPGDRVEIEAAAEHADEALRAAGARAEAIAHGSPPWLRMSGAVLRPATVDRQIAELSGQLPSDALRGALRRIDRNLNAILMGDTRALADAGLHRERKARGQQLPADGSHAKRPPRSVLVVRVEDVASTTAWEVLATAWPTPRDRVPLLVRRASGQAPEVDLAPAGEVLWWIVAIERLADPRLTGTVPVPASWRRRAPCRRTGRPTP